MNDQNSCFISSPRPRGAASSVDRRRDSRLRSFLKKPIVDDNKNSEEIHKNQIKSLNTAKTAKRK